MDIKKETDDAIGVLSKLEIIFFNVLENFKDIASKKNKENLIQILSAFEIGLEAYIDALKEASISKENAIEDINLICQNVFKLMRNAS